MSPSILFLMINYHLQLTTPFASAQVPLPVNTEVKVKLQIITMSMTMTVLVVYENYFTSISNVPYLLHKMISVLCECEDKILKK